MIKVQPANSRIDKTETADRLTLTYPPKGLLSAGGFLVLFGLAWLATMVWVLLRIEDKVVQIGAGFLMLPGLVIFLTGLGMAVHRWSFERTSVTVLFRRGGLWGSTLRKWPAEDVSSFWVDVRNPHQGGSELIIGFRNGRNETLLVGTMEEDFRWIAALLKDPRGRRRTVPSTARAVAEPAPRRVDHSIEPAAVTVRKYESGVEMTFLPLLDVRGRWWKLLARTVVVLALIHGTGWALGELFGRSYPGVLTRVAVLIWLLMVLVKLVILKQSTVIQILDGLVTIVQNLHRGHSQFPVEEVEYVQTYRASRHTELQFLLRGKPKVRVLHDRPPDELEWAARFLRVAIKGRAPEVEATMKMETAAGDCQVCGERMDVRVIFCGKCRTPHHEECWSYVGQCSTYGCREIRFTRA